MKSLREILEKADTGKSAIGHFNVSDLVTLKAVFEAARGLKVPVIVGVSEGERQFMGRLTDPGGGSGPGGVGFGGMLPLGS